MVSSVEKVRPNTKNVSIRSLNKVLLASMSSLTVLSPQPGVPMERSDKMCVKGGYFGDLALQKDKGKNGLMRQESVLAIEDCHFAILNMDAYDVKSCDGRPYLETSTNQSLQKS